MSGPMVSSVYCLQHLPLGAWPDQNSFCLTAETPAFQPPVELGKKEAQANCNARLRIAYTLGYDLLFFSNSRKQERRIYKIIISFSPTGVCELDRWLVLACSALAVLD